MEAVSLKPSSGTHNEALPVVGSGPIREIKTERDAREFYSGDQRGATLEREIIGGSSKVVQGEDISADDPLIK